MTSLLANNRQGSISPTFYTLLLHVQIPKRKKGSPIKQLFALLGSAGVKAACKQVGEIDPWHIDS